MPRYTYKCSACLAEIQARHSMSETLTVCTECKAEIEGIGTLKRVPSLVSITSNKKDKQTSGQKVEQFIETAKKELSEQAQEARKDYEC
jgi:putative FmdB family regulatory protein